MACIPPLHVPHNAHSDQTIVDFTLIDVSIHFDQSSDVQSILNEALDLGCICLTEDVTIIQLSPSTAAATKKGGVDAQRCISSTDNNAVARENIKKSVMRFVKPQDRHLALGSALLKSRAYHQTLFEEREGGPEPVKTEETSTSSLSLIDPPRTKYGKPYLLRIKGNSERSRLSNADCQDGDDEYLAQIQHTFSVSHQFPFVGISRLRQHQQQQQQQDSSLQKKPLHVGFDIVMYEAPNPTLYATTSEFLEVFKDSFTPTEWGCIVDSSAAWFGRRRKSDEDSRKEFYLRWAVKEAYTKALGLGLGHEFGKFEIIFDCCDNEDGMVGLAEAVDNLSFSETKEGVIGKRLETMGRVRYTEKDGNNAVGEIWQFIFFELVQQGHSKDVDATGCACVCIGPFGENMRFDVFVQEEVLTLEDVIHWHQRE